jgi:hypothetical protein
MHPTPSVEDYELYRTHDPVRRAEPGFIYRRGRVIECSQKTIKS